MSQIDKDEWYLVEGEADGTRDSVLALGQDVELVLTKMMFFGEPEDSKEEMQTYLDALRDPDQWSGHNDMPETWSLALEQGSLGVSLIRDLSAILGTAEKWWGREVYETGIISEHEFKTRAEGIAYVIGYRKACETAANGTSDGDFNPLEDHAAHSSNICSDNFPTD